MFRSEKNTLSEQIKRSFSARILICLLVYFIVFIALTAYDFSRGLHQINKNLNLISRDLSEYVISQALISNEENTEVKLKLMGKQQNMHITLDHSGKIKSHLTQWQLPFKWTYATKVISLDNRDFGTLIFKGSFLNNKELLYEIGMRATLLLLFLIMMLVTLYPLSVKIPKALFLDPLMSILSLLKKDLGMANKHHHLPTIELEEIQDRIQDLISEAQIQSHDAAIGKVTAQVAHDIRSPLTILNSILTLPETMDLPHQTLVRHALEQINCIANNLLLNDKKTENVQEELIYSLLEKIIFAKKMECTPQIDLNFDCTTEARSLLANINQEIFTRIISNILNNSIEALPPTDGHIRVLLSTNSKSIKIQIIDNGFGIPEKIISKVFDYRFTYGKKEGSGLGLYFAKLNIEAWNGKIELESSEELGTKVIIQLPLTPNKKFKNPDIILIDNDDALCSAWRIKAELADKKLITFNSTKAFQAQMERIPKQTPIYIDSDLGNNQLGEVESKVLYDQGFKIIFLATGKIKSQIIKPFWIKEIVSKYPPF